MHVIERSNAGEALDPRDRVRERCPARERRETSDHKSDQPSATGGRMPMPEGASLRSRVPQKCAPCHAQTELPPEVAGVQG